MSTASPVEARTNSEGSPMNRPIRVGIAGLGRAGWFLHAATLAKLPDYRITGVHDPIEERTAQAATEFGCVGYRSPLDLVAADDLDVVVVASPSASHAELAVAALRHGKHVLVEKPFATSLADAEQMISAASAARRLLLPSHNLRHSRTFLTMRDVLDSGKLGAIVEAKTHWHSYKRRWDWQTIPELGGGALNNDGSHVIDQVLSLFGDHEPDIFCRGHATPLSAGGAEDHVKLVLTAAGTIVDIELSNACGYPQPRWLVMGVNGTLVVDESAVRWRYLDPATLAERVATAAATPDRSYNREDLQWTEHEVGLADEAYADSHFRMYEALRPVLRGTQPPPIPLTSVRRQMALMDRCRAAMAAHQKERTG
jgi:scyllo-inositol 2-dehydrogenase (NADP+)